MPILNELLPDLLQDALYTQRQLRRAPGFSLTVLITLALAVGATAAIAGVLRATLLNPLPYPHPDQLVQIADTNLRGFPTSGLVAVARTQDLRRLEHGGHPVFGSLAYTYPDPNASVLTIDGQPGVAVPSSAVSGDFFHVAGVAPLLGRVITAADDVPNGPQLLVLSYRLWSSAFARDPAVIGRTVHLGPDEATIIGVMPERFDLPAGSDLWHPGHVFAANFGSYRGDGSRFVDVFARLAPTEDLASTETETAVLAKRLASTYPQTDAAWGFSVTTLRSSLFGHYRRALLLLSAAVALVLFASAINLAGLQLSRNAARASEFAIRGALGVSRARLVRQLLTENFLLVLLGSCFGVALGSVLLHLLNAHLPLALLRLERPHIDGAVLAAACLMAVVVGLLTGVLPALQSTRVSNVPRRSSRVTGGRTRRSGRAFAVAQIALALVLLTVSATVLDNLYRLLNTPLGFDPAHLHTFSVDLPWGVDPAKLARLYADLETGFAALPGVESVGSTTALPLAKFSIRRTFDIFGQPPTPNHDAIVADGRDISPGYLPTLRIPLLAGRNFSTVDAQTSRPPVLLINQTLAKRYFPATNPIGKHLRTWHENLDPAHGSTGSLLDAGEIIGIVGDVHGTGGSLTAPLQPEVYTPSAGSWPHMQFAIRTIGGSPQLETQLRSILASRDGTASLGHVSTLALTLHHDLDQPRLNAALLTSFAALSLLLVVIGIYGLVAFDVAQRTRELGLRLALGATRSGLITLLLRESSRILAAGLALGLVGSVAAAHLSAAAVAGPQPHTVALALATAALLSLAVLSASLLPARRAASVDPNIALRAE